MSQTFPWPGDLIPHRPPMLLLGAVLSHADHRTECEARFEAGFASFCGGEVSSAFGLELIAQAAAVHHALRSRVESGCTSPATRGLLLGSRRIRLLARTLPVEEPLRVTIYDDARSPNPDGMIRFEGEVVDAARRVLVRGDVMVLETPASP